MLSLRQNKRSVFSRTCAGKRHLKSRERGDENEVYGEKTTERASCEVRLLSSRHILKISSFPGHAPGKDTLRAANAATKEGVNGGENARASFCAARVFAPPSKSRERGDENEVHGEKTTERASCEVRLLSSRLNLSSRRSPKGG